MKETLNPGVEHTLSFLISKEKTVPFVYPESDLFREMPEVFATAFLVGFMEWACMEALRPYLEEGERTLGTMINITHQAASNQIQNTSQNAEENITASQRPNETSQGGTMPVGPDICPQGLGQLEH